MDQLGLSTTGSLVLCFDLLWFFCNNLDLLQAEVSLLKGESYPYL